MLGLSALGQFALGQFELPLVVTFDGVGVLAGVPNAQRMASGLQAAGAARLVVPAGQISLNKASLAAAGGLAVDAKIRLWWPVLHGYGWLKAGTIATTHIGAAFAGAGGVAGNPSIVSVSQPFVATGFFPSMRVNEINEAVGIIGRVLNALLQNSPTSSSAALRQAVGDLLSAAATDIATGNIATPLFNCFDLAAASGANYQSMAQVRGFIENLPTPVYRSGQLLITAMVQFCLIEESKSLSNTTFVSRDDVDAAIAYISPAFDDAIVYVSGLTDTSDVYMALTNLYGAVISDLATRSRPLPRMVTYNFGQSMPVLWIAQRLYADPTRAQEIVAENKIVHPLFPPRSIRALSA